MLLAQYPSADAAAAELQHDSHAWLQLDEQSEQLLEVLQAGDLNLAFPHRVVEIWYLASYTSSLRPHILVACGLIHLQLKASHTSSSRPHTLVAQGRMH